MTRLISYANGQDIPGNIPLALLMKYTPLLLLLEPPRAQPSGLPSSEAEEPIDDSWRETFHSRSNEDKVGMPYLLICRDIFEIRRTKISGKVVFQCACCRDAPISARAKYSIIAPQSIGAVYRSINWFITHHVHACDYIPQEIKDVTPKKILTVHKAKKYWACLATKKGLRNSSGSDNSVVYTGSLGH